MAHTHIIGYDPGGERAHGLALLSLNDNGLTTVQTRTCGTVEEVVSFIEGLSGVAALGVDTLTCWSTGPAGWRPADRWLRDRYQDVQKSVMSPNGLAGSMGLNGMSVLISTRERLPNVMIIETHPKVLYRALSGKKYDYESIRPEMEQLLCDACGATVAPANDHEWDAVLSAHAAARGFLGTWTRDLHALPTQPTERLIRPCGATNYYWPE